MLSSLANLQNLQLHVDAFVGRVLVFPKGGFPRLQEIGLSDLRTLEQWEVGAGAMPLLRYLRLQYCRNLRMLPEGLGMKDWHWLTRDNQQHQYDDKDQKHCDQPTISNACSGLKPRANRFD
ncbi:hypothetical protein ZIOFF_008663 [Zingiber officinale]|uniref:Uncharacterized protein n=1 Tax=Zingiber officinale TaxID=94328 RepID=A0A8J5LQX6_ZINOF|nr:hypothetical protein ZIOFF_008663 [Zingiber officinale]